MTTLTELFKKSNELREKIEETERTLDKNRNELKQLKNRIAKLELIPAESQDGASYFVQLGYKNTSKLLSCIEFLLNEVVRKGKLAEIIEEHQVVGYWHNGGFRSGHTRLIGRYCGEDNATELASIRFTNDVYEGKVEVNEAFTKNVIVYLEYLINELTTSTKAESLIGSVVILDETQTICIVEKDDDGDVYLNTPWDWDYSTNKHIFFSNALFDNLKYTVRYSGDDYVVLNKNSANSTSSYQDDVINFGVGPSRYLWIAPKK